MLILGPELFKGGDVIAVAKELQSGLDGIDNPEMFIDGIWTAIDMMNRDPAALGVAGSNRLILHAEEAFQVDLDKTKPHELDYYMGKIEDIYCKATLGCMTWLGSVATSGFAAQLHNVRILGALHAPTGQIHQPLVVPVSAIKGYLLAA